MDTGEKIKSERLSLGWTQDELARRMGYKSKSTINKIELGVNDITLPKARQFAAVLGVSEEYLMTNTEEKQPTEISELSKRKRDFIERFSRLSEEEIQKFEQILQIVEEGK